MRLAFVLTPDLPSLDARKILGAYARIAPKAPALREEDAGGAADTRAAEGKGGEGAEGQGADVAALAFRLGDAGDSVMVASMPVPVPNGEADRAARFSLSAYRGGWTLPPHRGHVLVTCKETASCSAVEALTRHARVVAAVAEATGAVGVYVGAAGATHEARFYVDVVREIDRTMPLMIWTGVSLASDGPNRMSLLTLGMEQLGVRNLLITAPKSKGNETLGFAFDLLAYIVRRGTPIGDGETVGRTAKEKIPFRYVASPIREGETVARIELP